MIVLPYAYCVSWLSCHSYQDMAEMFQSSLDMPYKVTYNLPKKHQRHGVIRVYFKTKFGLEHLNRTLKRWNSFGAETGDVSIIPRTVDSTKDLKKYRYDNVETKELFFYLLKRYANNKIQSNILYKCTTCGFDNTPINEKVDSPTLGTLTEWIEGVTCHNCGHLIKVKKP